MHHTEFPTHVNICVGTMPTPTHKADVAISQQSQKALDYPRELFHYIGVGCLSST